MIGTSRSKLSGSSSTAISGNQATLISLGILFLAGVLSGTIIATRIDEYSMQFLLDILSLFTNSRASQTITVSFLNALFANASLIILSTLFGFCAIGAPFIFLLPYFKGLGVGVLISGILLSQGLAAVNYIVLLIIPTTIIITITLIISCKESLEISMELYKVINPNLKSSSNIRIGDFIGKSIVLIIIAVGVSALESYLFSTFGSGFIA